MILRKEYLLQLLSWKDEPIIKVVSLFKIVVAINSTV